MAVRIQGWPQLQYMAWGCLVLNIQLFYAKEGNYKSVTATGALQRSVVPEQDTQ